MLARNFDDLDDVLEGVLGGEVGDAHAARLARPVERLQRLHDLLARLALLAGRDGILEIEANMVALRLRCLLHHLLARAGRVNLDAAVPAPPLRPPTSPHATALSPPHPPPSP